MHLGTRSALLRFVVNVLLWAERQQPTPSSWILVNCCLLARFGSEHLCRGT